MLLIFIMFLFSHTKITHPGLQGWVKGVVFINGKNLGRYWSIGPQQTLYVPGPWLHRGDNQVCLSYLYLHVLIIQVKPLSVSLQGILAWMT